MQCNHGLTMLLLILLLRTTMVSSGKDRKADILQNLSLVYEPRRSIRLWTPYKKPNATWTVRYRWDVNRRKRCSKESDFQCEDVSPEGQCSPCFIQLSAYDGYCQYRGQGTVLNTVNFKLSIHNESASHRFYLPDWIKPGPVDNIQVQHRGSSWLTLRLSPPARFDQCHLKHANGDNSLVFNYTVDLVSLKEQSLLQEEGRLFYETYGFVRHLEDDELALSQTVRSAFPRHFEPQVWKSNESEFADHPSKQTRNVTQLPLAGYYYNISVHTRAHYPGATVWIRAETDESAPEEGPGLHPSFAYCPSTSEHCAACIIYFKEIPRPRRGGTILNHTLTLTLRNTGDISAGTNCGSKSNMEASTGGHNNTIYIPSLPVGAVYTVSLQAFNSKGPSPSTTAVLHVRAPAPPFAAEDIVVESSGATYEMSWRSGQEFSDIKVRYTVHTCSALPLQLSGNGSNHTAGPSLPPQPLNCVTNMVSKELPENHPNSHTFVALPRGRGLTPVFFLSTTTPTNLTSGLLPVDYFYAKNSVPAKVKSLDVQAMDNDPGGIKVKFRLPCGHHLDYNYGRPDSYPIGVEKGDGSVNQCSKRMTTPVGHCKDQIKGNIKETVTYDRRGLKHGSNYCVCIYMFARNDVFRRGMGFCKTFKTGTEPESSTPFPVLLVSVAVAAIVGLVIIICGTRKCTQHYQQQQKKFETLDEKATMIPRPPVKKKLQNGDVRGFTNPAILSQNSGVLSLPAPHWMIDFLSDNPPADAADGLSDQEGAEDSEEVSESVEEGEYRVDEGSATDRTNSRYQSQSSNTESADNSQASRGTAGRQAVLRASRYAAAVADRYSSQFAGEQDVNVEMEEDEEEEDLEEEEAEEVWIY
ncbi:uncharacterized protein [Littorina saxatilis]|uniref:uncharacterized protein n=1 Tax=Littorina saxatilis TaxID=31220 RepID=UPI0038B535BE